MIGKYYLGQILNPTDPTRFKKGYLNLIQVFPGGGKTHFAFNTLPQYAFKKDFMLYITDTIMNQQQILAIYDVACGYTKGWRHFVNTTSKASFSPGFGNYIPPTTSDKVVVMNYAQVAALLYYEHEFNWGSFEYVVCDEIHNLIHYSNIKMKNGSPSFLSLVIQKINDTLKRWPKTTIIGMTATPMSVFKKFDKIHPVLSPTEIEDVKHYETGALWYYKDYGKVLRTIPHDRKGIIYFDHITTIKTVEKLLKNRGYKTGSFWSTANKDHPMTKRQLNIRQYIINKQQIPRGIDILLINASAQTGINIRNKDFDFMLIHASMGSDTLIQARGRLRNDLNRLFFYKKDCDIEPPNPVPTEYLDRFITATEMKEVCEEVRLMKPNGKGIYKSNRVNKYLSENGYIIESGSTGKKRWYRITLKSKGGGSFG